MTKDLKAVLSDPGLGLLDKLWEAKAEGYSWVFSTRHQSIGNAVSALQMAETEAQAHKMAFDKFGKAEIWTHRV